MNEGVLAEKIDDTNVYGGGHFQEKFGMETRCPLWLYRLGSRKFLFSVCQP